MRSYEGFRRIAVATAAALTLALGAGVASAQPAPGPWMHGPGMQGPHDEMIGHLIARAKAQLNLNTMQQGMFDAAVAASKAVRDGARTQHQTVLAALQAELAKPEPDLAAVATAADKARQATQSQRIAVRDQWLALYATFTFEQKAVVKTLLQQRLARAESFREKMIQYWQQKQGGGTTATTPGG